MVDMDLLREFAQRTLEKRRLDGEANKLSKWIAEIEPTILEQMSEDGVSSVKLDGIGTAFIRSQLWAGSMQDDDGVTDKQATCDALKAAGLGLFVSEGFNANTLSSWVREQPKDELGDPVLPPELEGKLSVARVFHVGVRKAGE